MSDILVPESAKPAIIKAYYEGFRDAVNRLKNKLVRPDLAELAIQEAWEAESRQLLKAAQKSCK